MRIGRFVIVWHGLNGTTPLLVRRRRVTVLHLWLFSVVWFPRTGGNRG